ncbi:unnamed protein product [Hermetia illucens]|uniref:Vitellogenin n=1 Tax=Hermetia illucens TaxID=343691 RepID=A0A7R8UGH2_HERIL|nr:unnamed protein product [Hermetia illucens]
MTMELIHRLIPVLILIIITSHGVISARRNPLQDPRICGPPQCEIEAAKFAYNKDSLYKYDYVMHIKSDFVGSGENTSDLYLTAKIELSFKRECEGLLALNTVELRNKPPPVVEESETEDYDYSEYIEPDADIDPDLHPNSSDIASDISRYELRFSFHDGEISEVCPAEDEPNWVLNFKKGLLSALQNSMIRFDVDRSTTETDVSGKCNVVYALQGANGTKVEIQKRKDISSCNSRYQTKSILQTSHYNFRDNKAVWPILNSVSYCNLSVDNHIYDSVSCFERHQLVPLSNNNTGAVTESLIKLIFTGEDIIQTDETGFAYTEDDIIKRRSSLLYDHNATPKPTHGEIKASRDLLKQMCRLGFPNIQREFIEYFTKFLETARMLSYKALHQLLARAASVCVLGKNHVLESLPYIGSSASIFVMRDQLVGEAIPKNMARNWLTALSFTPRPSVEILEIFLSLIEYGKKVNEPDYILGSTAVIHTFCRYHSNCGNYDQVKQIVQFLENEGTELLTQNLNLRKFKERMIITLKGIGNIGIVSNEFLALMRKIVVDPDIPVEIRVQTMLSFRKIDCLSNRPFFLSVYQNFTENAEIRILSYIQAMRCPDYHSIRQIKHILETEEVNQVGSYVWSHLTNLAKSASPVRVEAQGLLTDGDLSDKFKMDFRRFSRNFEHSLFFDEYNFGTATDGNLIFGTDSYLPRLVSLNFTADLFGESVNFFELSTRIQGFEQFFASIFGPKGPLNSNYLRKKFTFLNKYFGDDTVEEKGDLLNLDKFRMKRDSESGSNRKERSNINEVKGVQNKIDELGYKLKYNYNEPRAVFNLRVFGNDLKYYTMEGMGEVVSAINDVNPINSLAKLLSGKEITYTKSGVFLDASYNVPMSSGLPLSVHAFGASSVDLRMSGSLANHDHTSGDWNFDVEGKLKPSISVDVLLSMQTDLFYATSGTRVKSNLYSSSSVEAKLKVRGSNLVSLTFGLPQDKNDILSVRSKLLVMRDAEEIPQKGIDRRYSNATCTWPIIDRAIGLQFCANYSLPDLSNSTHEYPGLVLSGPINLNLHVNKADVTAKTFVFEYRSLQVGNNSNSTFVFETPGSAIPRKFITNVHKTIEIANLTMAFTNGETTHSVVGFYKNNPDDRTLNIFLDSNGTKNLVFEMGMNRSVIRNGYMYNPRFFLSVQKDRIAGASGTIKAINKNGIEQYDINVTFETKKLQSRIIGNIIKTSVSYSTKMKVDYRFQDNKIEAIEFDGEIADRSQRSRTEYKGRVKLKTTAYPLINLASNLTVLSLLGHTEGKLTYNNAPDLLDPQYTTTFRVIFARTNSDEMTDIMNYGTRASLEIQRPISDTDFRVLLIHEERNKNGPKHNLLIGIRYAHEKEATAAFSLFLPRLNLFAVDAAMNITVPAFDSCTARLRLVEKNENDYNIDFNGMWFSHHSIAIKGSYQDKSSRIKSNHHLKLMIQSPSFNDTAINIIYRRNEMEILFNGKAEYNKLPYGLIINYSRTGNGHYTSHIEIQFRDKSYWLSSKLQAVQPKMLHAELHLDKFRDIHIDLRGLSALYRKEASVELKWDANRDPSQRLALMAEYSNPEWRKYDASVMITYPERTFSGGFHAFTGGPEYQANGRVSWNTNEAIAFNFDAGYIPGEATNNWILAEVETPFPGWKRNRLHGGIYYENNLLLVNGSLLWADQQNIGLQFKGDYLIQEPLFSCEVKMALNSTIQDVPTLNAHFKHKQDLRKFNTIANVRHHLPNETVQSYSIKSDWQIDRNEFTRYINGSIQVKSPFNGYKTAAIATKFSISHGRNIKGGATLDVEARKFTLDVEGYMRKVTDNKLQINITTPIEKFKTINGRFGINDKLRHGVAEVRAPAGALGAEILLDIITFTDFDVKLSLATPFENLTRMILIGKSKPETIDMRGGLNNVTVGFTGVWRKSNLTDFEYSYKVFTPLKGFEENGAIAKFVKLRDFTMELYMKLSSYKVGIALAGRPKSNLIAELSTKGIEMEFEEDEVQKEIEEDEEEYEDDYEIDYEDLLNYIGTMELDTLLWPTITGSIDISEIEEYYLVVGKLNLPQGEINLRDRLYYPDLLTIKNKLRISTPFKLAPEIKSTFQYNVEFRRKFLTELDISVLHAAEWKTAGYFVNYTVTTDETEAKTHDVAFKLKTPLQLLRKLDLTGFLELEDSIYRGNFTAETEETALSFGGSLETDDNYLDTYLGMSLRAPTVPNYTSRIYFKKDFSEVENSVTLGFDARINEVDNKFQTLATWYVDETNYINAKGQIETNIIPLKLAQSSILITSNPSPMASLDISFLDSSNEKTEFHAMAVRRKEFVTVEVSTPLADYKNISLSGTLIQQPTKGQYKLRGNFYKNMAGYNVDGLVVFLSDIPVFATLKLKSKTGGPDGSLEYSLRASEGNYGKTFQLKALEGQFLHQIGGGYSMRSHLNWDFMMLLQSNDPGVPKITMNATLLPQRSGQMYASIEIKTPWKHLGIDHVNLGAKLDLQDVGEIRGNYRLSDVQGNGSVLWSWILLENMQFGMNSVLEHLDSPTPPRVFQAGLKYLNPDRNLHHLVISGNVNVDSLWVLDLNGTLMFLSARDMALTLVAQLPKPIGDIHRLLGRYRGNLMTKEPLDVTVEAKYESDEARRRFSTKGNYRHVEGNIHMLKKGEKRREFSGRIATPFHRNEDSLFVSGSIDQKYIYHMFTCKVHYPAKRKVVDTDVSFSSVSNMFGYMNTTFPFFNMTWLRGDFNFSTMGGDSLQYMKAAWKKDFALYEHRSNFKSKDLDRDVQGTILIQVPLESRHSANIEYGLKERQAVMTGHANMRYNNKNVVNSKYTCKSEQRVGYEKNVVDVSVENKFKPLGIHYVHSRQYSRSEAPEYDMKHIQIFELNNATNFNVTGELHIRSTFSGQEYKILAIHPNRTVTLTSDYDSQESSTRQRSKIQLAPKVWIGYNIRMENRSNAANESHAFSAELFYPRRNLSAEGFYFVTDNMFDSDIIFRWGDPLSSEYSNSKKVMNVGLQWRSHPLTGTDKDNQTALISISHPSFRRNATLEAFYYRDGVHLIKSNVTVRYTYDPDHTLTLGVNAKDLTHITGSRNYSIDIQGKHKASQFELDVQGTMGSKPALYKTESHAHYSRGYLPSQDGLFIAMLDLKKKIIHYHRMTPYKTVRLWTQPFGSYPLYGMNLSLWDSPDLNSTGYVYVDLNKKYTRMELNLTSDASHNVQMVGLVPDARSAYFDLWRNYDEIRVIDIAYYLRMNHSRLITSQLSWRPKLKSDIKNKFRDIATSFYQSASDGIDFWIKTLYVETVDTINDIWNNAKPYTQEFLDDLSGLTVLEEDLEELRKFVNRSYEANDFYIKTVVNFTLTVVDELAIRDHIESLPKIITELWHIMGDSGKALRKNLLWLFETIKTSYQKGLEMISKFLHGEALEHLSGFMGKAVEKYDKFVKDLHLSLIKYVENLWNKFAIVLENYWKTTLRKLEPHIIKFLHYIETALWNISKEIFDFIYERTNELAESPYFNQVSSFTHDMDRLYKDLSANDAITNFRKYSVIAWNFVKEKYFKLVPFGKELNDVLNELWEELKTLEKLETVQFFVQRVNEIKLKAEWLADEFQLDKRLHQLWHLIRNKIASYTQTALQADDRYREAKTKFIFDPDVGLIEFEQKLPMSWHAFNETPKFEEVPEYKMMNDIQTFFSGSNFSLMNYIYGLRPHIDPSMWLPPFKSHSLLIGSRHYMTFDNQFVALDSKYTVLAGRSKLDQCSYLLTHDFFQRNFSLFLEPSIIRQNSNLISSKKLVLVTDTDILEMDVSGDTLAVNKKTVNLLPVEVGSVLISRDSDVLTIESREDYILSCNLQFDLCWFELGGYYYGQTAGLLGTTNNEPFDDMTAANGEVTQNEDEFVKSWSFKGCGKSLHKKPENYSTELLTLCTEFFETPYFSSCFSNLDPKPFYDMCLDMGHNSISTVLKDNHPAQKGACTAALGYIEACAAKKIPLRIPDKCVHCDLINGSYVAEGTFVELKDHDVPRSADVVFIVEAKNCNANITHSKSILAVSSAIQKELVNMNMTNNRYSVLTFGGRAPFDKPRSVVYNNKVFTDYQNLRHYFDHIETNEGLSNDTFQAISAASKLIFRPGVSKIFILLPCSECQLTFMRFDYSSLLQLMLEEGINLHILMDKEFAFDKSRLSRIFFGMDRDFAYSKRDFKDFRGDVELRKQVRVPKEILGFCTPLAIETNGSVFTANKLRPEKRNPIKKFATIFARRVAKTALPAQCQTCECTGHNTGVAYMTCTSCSIMSATSMDYDFDEAEKDVSWMWEDDEEMIDDE